MKILYFDEARTSGVGVAGMGEVLAANPAMTKEAVGGIGFKDPTLGVRVFALDATEARFLRDELDKLIK